MTAAPARAALAFLLLAAACSGPPSSTPISVGPAPASFWTTLGSARRLFPGEPVPVVVAPFDGAPLQATDADGRYLEQLGVGSDAVQVAACHEEALESGERLSFCTGMREGAPTLGRAQDGSVFRRLPGGKTVLVGESFGYAGLPDGERLLFTRAAGSRDAWLGSGGPKIWARGPGLTFVEAGEGRYLWATSGDGARRYLYMSRGPSKSDKWVGELDGVIYVEK